MVHETPPPRAAWNIGLRGGKTANTRLGYFRSAATTLALGKSYLEGVENCVFPSKRSELHDYPVSYLMIASRVRNPEDIPPFRCHNQEDHEKLMDDHIPPEKTTSVTAESIKTQY